MVPRPVCHFSRSCEMPSEVDVCLVRRLCNYPQKSTSALPGGCAHSIVAALLVNEASASACANSASGSISIGTIASRVRRWRICRRNFHSFKIVTLIMIIVITKKKTPDCAGVEQVSGLSDAEESVYGRHASKQTCSHAKVQPPRSELTLHAPRPQHTMRSIGSATGSGISAGGANLTTRTTPQQLCGSVDSRTSSASSVTLCTCSAMCARCVRRCSRDDEYAAMGMVTIAAHLHATETS